jgi:FKBP-type peptidyl-prolyl cis-trans isomerase FkpA
VRKIQTQVLSIVAILIIGFTMFSLANATTPEENKAAGVAFLAENAKKPNVVTTASGLQYEVLTPGTGTTSPTATDNVTVHYKGTTIDGAEFDSSYSRGEPATFPLNRVIPGWTEGVQLMKEGAKYRFFIPSELAYGEHGAGRAIGPNAALIFDVELIKIQ